MASDRQRAARVLAMTAAVDNLAIPPHSCQFARQLVPFLPSQVYCTVLEHGVHIAQRWIDVPCAVIVEQPCAFHSPSRARVERVAAYEPAAIGRTGERQVMAEHWRTTVVIDPTSVNIHDA